MNSATRTFIRLPAILAYATLTAVGMAICFVGELFWLAGDWLHDQSL